MGETTPIRVVYDADCPLCRGARSWVERRDIEGRFLFEPPDPRTAAADRVLTVEDADGARSGFQGWVAILELLPGWRRLAGVLHNRVVSMAGSGLYRLVAAGRGSLRRPRWCRPSEGRDATPRG